MLCNSICTTRSIFVSLNCLVKGGGVVHLLLVQDYYCLKLIVLDFTSFCQLLTVLVNIVKISV